MPQLSTLLVTAGSSVPARRRIYGAYRNEPDFVAEAITALRHLDPDMAWRAGWLLEAAAREQRIAESELARIASVAPECEGWAVRAYLCHVFSLSGCPASIRPTVFPFLEDCFGDRHVAIRAWALTALLTFADDPDYRDRIAAMLAAARLETGKAMTARLRRLGLAPYPPRRCS